MFVHLILQLTSFIVIMHHPYVDRIQCRQKNVKGMVPYLSTNSLCQWHWCRTVGPFCWKHSGSILECTCCLWNMAMHDYQDKKVWLQDRHTDRQADAGQSDPYVPLCFTDDTKTYTSMFHYINDWNTIDYNNVKQQIIKHFALFVIQFTKYCCKFYLHQFLHMYTDVYISETLIWIHFLSTYRFWQKYWTKWMPRSSCSHLSKMWKKFGSSVFKY